MKATHECWELASLAGLQYRCYFGFLAPSVDKMECHAQCHQCKTQEWYWLRSNSVHLQTPEAYGMSASLGEARNQWEMGLCFETFKHFNQLLIFYSLSFYLHLSAIAGAHGVAVWQTFQGRHTSHLTPKRGPMTDQSNTCIEVQLGEPMSVCWGYSQEDGWTISYKEQRSSALHTLRPTNYLSSAQLGAAGGSNSGTLFRAHRQFCRLTVQESPLSTVLLVWVV